jgi:hypothetical protein
MEVLNNIITNLTEEKENNAIKITNLLHENEKMKQNINNNNPNTPSTTQNNEGNKKYEEIILKLKKSMMNLKEENKTLEEVILKQESEVSQLSSKVKDAENILNKKDKELQESIEYSAKLTSSINFHKNEIVKIKQKHNNNEVNKNDKNSEIIQNLQKELQNMKKNLEIKESKLIILSSNNKNLQEKLNKLTQIIKNEINNDNDNNKYNNKNKNNKNIYSSYNNYYTNKISISKPQSQLKNKTSRISCSINPISSNILPKNTNINIENYKNNLLEKNPVNNVVNFEDKKLYVASKRKVKSKTPGKLVSSRKKIYESKNYDKNGKNDGGLYPSIYERQKSIKNSRFSINEKYKQIESKYKNDKKEITKEDTLFDEDDILNIKKEILNPINIDSIPVFKSNIEPMSNRSIENEFPIIESYYMMDKDNNKLGHNCITNDTNKNLMTYNEKDLINDSNLEDKQVQDLKDRVNKLLSEF